MKPVRLISYLKTYRARRSLLVLSRDITRSASTTNDEGHSLISLLRSAYVARRSSGRLALPESSCRKW